VIRRILKINRNCFLIVAALTALFYNRGIQCELCITERLFVHAFRRISGFKRIKIYLNAVNSSNISNVLSVMGARGHAVAKLVEAVRYKPEGRGFDSRWCHCYFSST